MIISWLAESLALPYKYIIQVDVHIQQASILSILIQHFEAAAVLRRGKLYTLSGHKWWASGAPDPRCRVCIFMGKTDPSAAAHKQQSMVLVPMDAQGLNIIRPLTVFGYDDAPHGHAEVIFEVILPSQHEPVYQMRTSAFIPVRHSARSSHGRAKTLSELTLSTLCPLLRIPVPAKKTLKCNLKCLHWHLLCT